MFVLEYGKSHIQKCLCWTCFDKIIFIPSELRFERWRLNHWYANMRVNIHYHYIYCPIIMLYHYQLKHLIFFFLFFSSYKSVTTHNLSNFIVIFVYFIFKLYLIFFLNLKNCETRWGRSYFYCFLKYRRKSTKIDSLKSV